ncbi:rubrerythrin family protein [Pontiella agarivorans]|uniref:Rubrerythrin family protein n=1 Tax=Pontiella agarivorans TaxID=3038953 RepID=A0ABU5MZS0_9BACT|nr:rubrerythrin family protein [Pontiella agarivorans]MDZ8119710.1 rubrerythrin family protein [Pontiella agarivorans]
MTSNVIAVLAATMLVGSSVHAGSSAATVANLKAAIKGETTASAKYAAFAKKAADEGYDKIALLFQATSKAETIHAGNHRAVLAKLGESMEAFTPEYTVKSTRENLEAAIEGEGYEVATMYPEFLKTAQKENVSLALVSFNYAYQTEKEHAALYKDAVAKLVAGHEDSLASQYLVCLTCGNTYAGTAPERCGICMTPRERFVTIQ